MLLRSPPSIFPHGLQILLFSNSLLLGTGVRWTQNRRAKRAVGVESYQGRQVFGIVTMVPTWRWQKRVSTLILRCLALLHMSV